jgi:hypothetical protein
MATVLHVINRNILITRLNFVRIVKKTTIMISKKCNVWHVLCQGHFLMESYVHNAQMTHILTRELANA